MVLGTGVGHAPPAGRSVTPSGEGRADQLGPEERQRCHLRIENTERVAGSGQREVATALLCRCHSPFKVLLAPWMLPSFPQTLLWTTGSLGVTRQGVRRR